MSTSRLYRRHVFDINKLRESVKEVFSWRALALKMGITFPSGTIYDRVRPLCNQYGIDYSHFTGQASNRGKVFLTKKRDINLYLSNELPINSHNLKLRLFQDGIKERCCEVCHLDVWNEKPIPIQLHHLDGNSANNNLSNLQIICPNCHAQTSSYCGRNQTRSKYNKIPVPDECLIKNIPLCYNPAQVMRSVGLSLAKAHYERIAKIMIANPGLSFLPKKRSKRVRRALNADPHWRTRPKPDQRKFVRPSKEELLKMIWSKPMETLAKEIGCNSNSIRKWCKLYGIEWPSIAYWARIRAGQTHEQALKQLTQEEIHNIVVDIKSGQSVRGVARRYNTTKDIVNTIKRKIGGPTESLARDVQLERLPD